MALKINVNGKMRVVASSPLKSLAEVLREEFHLTGTKLVCGEGFCGACNVKIDGRLVPSCLAPVGTVEGRSIETIEAPAVPGSVRERLVRALEDFDAVQCGMCFPGMVMSLSAHLENQKMPTRESLRQAMVGNICRCTGYERIIEAALSVTAEGAT